MTPSLWLLLSTGCAHHPAPPPAPPVSTCDVVIDHLEEIMLTPRGPVLPVNDAQAQITAMVVRNMRDKCLPDDLARFPESVACVLAAHTQPQFLACPGADRGSPFGQWLQDLMTAETP